MTTLPDYLCRGLDIAFVGINPGAYSAQVGRYFATPQNRFWGALSRSGLVPAAGVLEPGAEAWLNEHRIGFTDVVKRASNSASSLRAADFRRWSPVLREKLIKFEPRVVCFNGVTGYRSYLRYGERVEPVVELGPQERRIGVSRVFVVPSSSPANAAYSLDDLVEWYQRLGAFVQQAKDEETPG